jgi:hypothetical protein
MRWDEIAGSWRQVRGRVKEQWGKLTGNNLTAIAGKRERRVIFNVDLVTRSEGIRGTAEVLPYSYP